MTSSDLGAAGCQAWERAGSGARVLCMYVDCILRCLPGGSASQDFEAGSLYGLEKFWAFHHYTGLPEGSGLDIDPKVSTDESTLSS